MPRTKGSKNKAKNINTAKNKNIININVNSNTTKRKGRGRPKKTTNDTLPNKSLIGGFSAPPQVIVSQPQPDNSNNNSLLSSFISSKLLNETMSLNRTNIEQPTTTTTREQPSYFNGRESIIPKIPDTPISKTIINEIKPPQNTQPEIPRPPQNTQPEIPRPPPPPPPPKQQAQKPQTGATGLDAIVQEIKYLNSDEGKAEKARKKAEKEAKKNSQSTTDFLKMDFTPPKKDIVEMITPQKQTKSNEIIPYKENKSMLDFIVGGLTPQKLKTPGQHLETARTRLKELSKTKPTKLKEIFELNELKSELTGQPNPNKDIGGSIINRIVKSKLASKELEKKKVEKKSDAVKKIQTLYRGNKVRQNLATDQDFQNKIDMKIKDYGTAASEYHTRGKDSQEVNDEFSDVMKKMRTGLKNYKKTLGVQPKKPGPKPNPYKGLKQTEI